jgi:hypothetical protein
MEPMRPVVDRAVLRLIDTVTFTAADFSIQHDGVCRMNAELARRVVQLALERCSLTSHRLSVSTCGAGHTSHRCPPTPRGLSSATDLPGVRRRDEPKETYGGAQSLDGHRTGAEGGEQQIRMTYSQFITPSVQGLISVSHDVSATGQFKQDVGVLLRVTKLF